MTFWFFKDFHFVFWEKPDAYLCASAAVLVICNYKCKMAKMTVWNHVSTVCFGCNQTSHWASYKRTDWYPFDVRYKPVMYAVYYLLFTWLQIAFLSRVLHVMGCRVSSSHGTIKALMSSHSHFHMISCDAKQWYKTESLIMPHSPFQDSLQPSSSSLYKQ